MSSAGNAPSTKSTTLFVCISVPGTKSVPGTAHDQSVKKGLPQSEKEKKISLIDFHRLTLGGRPPSFGTFTASALITLPYIQIFKAGAETLTLQHGGTFV
jgi:hypothetical protein